MGRFAARNAPLAPVTRRISRLVAGLLCGTLALQPVWSQSAGPSTQQTSESSAQPGEAAPTRLQIRVLTPVPLTEPAGALSANQVMVQVLDGWGMPVPGAAVSFRLPEAGPGGVFLNGLSTEVSIADREGKAAVKGFDWRGETGTSFLHIIAAYGDVRSGAMVEVQLGKRVAGLPPAAVVAPPATRAAAPLEEAVASARPASGGREPAGAAQPASAFPLPAEAAASSPSKVTPGRQSREPSATVQGVVVRPINRSPREIPPSRPPADYQSVDASLRPRDPAPAAEAETREGETASFVTVKQKPRGLSKALVFLIVAGAAAGGALAAGMASSGSSASSGGPSTPAAPTITIGSPTITVTGGGN